MDISISCAQLCRSELPKAGLGIVDVGPRQIPTPPGEAFLFCGPENLWGLFNGNFRYLKLESWPKEILPSKLRYVNVAFFRSYELWGYSLKLRPYIGLIYGRYLQSRFLKWPLIVYGLHCLWGWVKMGGSINGGYPIAGWFINMDQLNVVNQHRPTQNMDRSTIFHTKME